MVLVTAFEEAIDRCSFDENIDELPEILSMLSGYIQDIRKTELGHKNLLQHLFKLLQNNPDNKKNYTFGMTAVKAYVYTTMEWTERALQKNRDICTVMVDMRNTSSNVMMADCIDISDLSNVRELQEPDDMPSSIDLKDKPMFMKQQSEEWFEVEYRSFSNTEDCRKK